MLLSLPPVGVLGIEDGGEHPSQEQQRFPVVAGSIAGDAAARPWWTLEPDTQGLTSRSITFPVCDLGQVPITALCLGSSAVKLG